MRLQDKVALVTGASRGIGAEVACALAKEGAVIIVNYNGSKEKAESVVSRIQAAGGTAEVYKCDVADFAQCGEMIDTLLKKHQRIDILVNNAGITRDNLLMKMSETEFDDVISTNLKGCFNTIRHMSRQFLKQKSGRIINMSSISGIMGNMGQANYSASKAGVIGLTKSVAKELGSRGITVNAVAPGLIDTEMTQVLPESTKEAMLSQISLRRMGTTKNIADAVVFLASEEAEYITGQVLSVDGGM